MGNRIGVIFHEDWEEYSPLMYSHYGAGAIPFELQEYLRDYYKKYDIEDHNSGHLYNPCHMMVGFLQSLDKDIHVRVENLNTWNIEDLNNLHKYNNCFEGGCWIINVSRNNYGKTECNGMDYYLENNNIFKDELENIS